jgi:hypothetical protein
MRTLTDDLAIEARRMRVSARFLPVGLERARQERLAEMLDNAARRLEAYESVADGFVAARKAVAA